MEEGELFDPEINRNSFLHCYGMIKKNIIPCIWIIHGMNFEFEYICEFKFLFEDLLGSESRSYLGSIRKKQQSKISWCKCTFNPLRTCFNIIKGCFRTIMNSWYSRLFPRPCLPKHTNFSKFYSKVMHFLPSWCLVHNSLVIGMESLEVYI